jgi:aspartate/methionine/tyrosine aminotransferase
MSATRSHFQPFEMERMMSKWENVVEYNLSESGVHPLSVAELVEDPAVLQQVLNTPLHYPQTNGIVELRENIAALYPGATPDNVLVTVGCIEANFISLQTMVAPGEEIALMLPNYMQIWGVARNLGIKVRTFQLREELGWGPDLDQLNDVVSEKTKLIAVCNPDNPTGHILTGEEMEAIVSAADRVGAWLLADEVYSGAERLTDTQTPSFWGRYDKVLAVNSMSKAYGLPGLRLGWVVAPLGTVEDIWAGHDYVTISASMLSNQLAAIALSPRVRPRLLQRTRDYIRRGYPILDAWVESHEGTFSLIPPDAAAIAYVRYDLHINSTELVDRLVREESVIIVPGDHFGMDRYLRISFGLPEDYLRTGLDRIHEFIVGLQA